MDPLNHPYFIHVKCFGVKHRAGHWCSVPRLSALFTSGPKTVETVETVEAVGALNFDQKFTSTTSTGSALWSGQWFLEWPVLRRIFIHLEVKQNAAAWARRLKDSKVSHCKTSLETFRMFFLILCVCAKALLKHFDVWVAFFVFFVKLNEYFESLLRLCTAWHRRSLFTATEGLPFFRAPRLCKRHHTRCPVRTMKSFTPWLKTESIQHY